MRELNTQEYISMLRELINEGKEVGLIVSGSSMAPFLIHHRDRVFLSRPCRELKTGDIVFYQRKNGQFVMHRIYKRRGLLYDMIGDAQTDIEYGVKEDQIFGLVTKVQRKGKWLTPNDSFWKLFSCLWIKIILLRPFIIKCCKWVYTKKDKKE